MPSDQAAFFASTTPSVCHWAQQRGVEPFGACGRYRRPTVWRRVQLLRRAVGCYASVISSAMGRQPLWRARGGADDLPDCGGL
ncbi:hypothetical protein I551_3537 [Mycobacterium ulcerans str. Harvey]|uniref:Uncharacterized protein n=1 Tax=Mycobacterium ulcerans str. Harvey TaxID=1299332 RepID=A0ABP3AEW9_MYCUL|nr:hypothetical protein I551_3537 [Mycobacterium ulcerans str. Harvey]